MNFSGMRYSYCEVPLVGSRRYDHDASQTYTKICLSPLLTPNYVHNFFFIKKRIYAFWVCVDAESGHTLARASTLEAAHDLELSETDQQVGQAHYPSSVLRPIDF